MTVGGPGQHPDGHVSDLDAVQVGEKTGGDLTVTVDGQALISTLFANNDKRDACFLASPNLLTDQSTSNVRVPHEANIFPNP